MICDVVSLIKQAYDLEIDFNAKHNYEPQCYKSVSPVLPFTLTRGFPS